MRHRRKRLRQTGPFTFITTGVADAITRASELAGGRTVVVASPTIARQCLDLGLLDEVAVSLAPVLLGDGIRWFDPLGNPDLGADHVVVG